MNVNKSYKSSWVIKQYIDEVDAQEQQERWDAELLGVKRELSAIGLMLDGMQDDKSKNINKKKSGWF